MSKEPDSVAIPAAEPAGEDAQYWKEQSAKWQQLAESSIRAAEIERASRARAEMRESKLVAADAQRTNAEGRIPDEVSIRTFVNQIAGLTRSGNFQHEESVQNAMKITRSFLAAHPASSAQPVMTTDPWDELIRVLTEYEGALQEQDEEEIAPAREALIAFLRPYRAHIEAAQGEMNRRIVCAANRKRFTGQVVLGIRHWDAFMSHIDSEGDPVDQGFIDNRGNFLSRTDAWKVADEAGQIIRRVGGDDADGGTLYSENLY